MPDNVDIDASSAGLASDCQDSGGIPWAFNLQVTGTGEDTFLMALDNTTGADAADQFACLTAGEIVPGTDIVAIKRAAGSATTAALNTGDVAIRTNGTVASLFIEPITTPLAGTTEDWLYSPVIYFIRNFTRTAGDGIPSLCRVFLGMADPPSMQTECIAQGIENLQIEYGIDNDSDGSVNAYITGPTQAELEQTISVRFFILARTDDEDRAVDDTKTYAISNAADFTPNDNFHRRVFTTTVSVPNTRNRLLLGL